MFVWLQSIKIICNRRKLSFNLYMFIKFTEPSDNSQDPSSDGCFLALCPLLLKLYFFVMFYILIWAEIIIVELFCMPEMRLSIFMFNMWNSGISPTCHWSSWYDAVFCEFCFSFIYPWFLSSFSRFICRYM